MKKALVCGAGGFIGGHLVKKLRCEGYWVRGVDIKRREGSPDAADEFLQLDLRVDNTFSVSVCASEARLSVYQLRCMDVGA